MRASAGARRQGRGKARLTSEVTALSSRGIDDSIRAAPEPLEETTVPRSSPLPVIRRTHTERRVVERHGRDPVGEQVDLARVGGRRR